MFLIHSQAGARKQAGFDNNVNINSKWIAILVVSGLALGCGYAFHNRSEAAKYDDFDSNYSDKYTEDDSVNNSIGSSHSKGFLSRSFVADAAQVASPSVVNIISSVHGSYSVAAASGM
jgi:hypothetical protein